MKPPPDVGRLFVLLAGDGFKPFQDLHITSFALTEILPGRGRKGKEGEKGEKGEGGEESGGFFCDIKKN
ncbi:MAG: hypothetical protein HDS79_05205 [Bacteroidales bacterium]|nr:hypothetical protein [Bacteroidales bacterium]